MDSIEASNSQRISMINKPFHPPAFYCSDRKPPRPYTFEASLQVTFKGKCSIFYQNQKRSKYWWHENLVAYLFLLISGLLNPHTYPCISYNPDLYLTLFKLFCFNMLFCFNRKSPNPSAKTTRKSQSRPAISSTQVKVPPFLLAANHAMHPMYRDHMVACFRDIPLNTVPFKQTSTATRMKVNKMVKWMPLSMNCITQYPIQAYFDSYSQLWIRLGVVFLVPKLLIACRLRRTLSNSPIPMRSGWLIVCVMSNSHQKVLALKLAHPRNSSCIGIIFWYDSNSTAVLDKPF